MKDDSNEKKFWISQVGLSVTTGVFLLVLMLFGAPLSVNAQEINDIRLAGEEKSSGIPEIYFGNNRWGTVCDDGLGDTDSSKGEGVEEAKVACRQLGLTGGVSRGAERLQRPASSRGFLMNKVVCSGDEDKLTDCTHVTGTSIHCFGSETWGVTCNAPQDATGNSPVSGNLQITAERHKVDIEHTADTSSLVDDNGLENVEFMYEWYRVSEEITTEDFTVQRLFVITGATNRIYTPTKEDLGYFLKVQVTFLDDAGNQEAVESSLYGSIIENQEDGAIKLTAITNVHSPDTSIFVLLRPGPFYNSTGDPVVIDKDNPEDKYRGLIELWDDTTAWDYAGWKGVCDDGWGLEEAKVACRQLGLTGGTPLVRIKVSRTPTFNFLIDNVVCEGDENHLLYNHNGCDSSIRGITDCATWEYAGVSCGPPPSDN